MSPLFYVLKMSEQVDWTWETCSVPFIVALVSPNLATRIATPVTFV